MTDCSRCGDCCDPVNVPLDPQSYAAERLAVTAHDDEGWYVHQLKFFRDHWTSIGSNEVTENGETVTMHRVRCDQYDRATRTCQAHDNRPQVCSGYPWYGRAPGDPDRDVIAASLSPRCSFNADVPGRAMLPIVEVQHH